MSWHPNNPSLFATVNNEGYLDLFDISRDMEQPIAHQEVSKSALNKCRWNHDGSGIICGDSSGNVYLYALAEKWRKMDAGRYEGLQKVLNQVQESS